MKDPQNAPVDPPSEAHGATAPTGLAAVQEALANRPHGETSTASPASGADRLVARGDIRVVEPLPWMQGRRRLAVVRRVDADRDIADMVLAHTWPELATDADAVIATRESGLSHPLVVECYVRGPVWLLQVRERAGNLAESVLEAVGCAVVDGDATVEGVQTGLPLAGPTDPRWRFKEAEVAEWRALTDDCGTALLADDSAWPLEPEWLRPRSYLETSDSSKSQRNHLRLEETVHLINTRHIAVEIADLDPATFNPEGWVASLGRDLGIATFTALQPTLHRALARRGADLLKEAA